MDNNNSVDHDPFWNFNNDNDNDLNNQNATTNDMDINLTYQDPVIDNDHDFINTNMRLYHIPIVR